MNKQPYLTGFPFQVLATARRRHLAAIQAARKELVASAPCGYSLLFANELPPAYLQSIDPTVRQRHFGAIPVFWAWLAQILEGNASCSKALGHIQSWYRSSGLPVPTGDTGAYCQARKRLPVDFLHALFDKTRQGLSRHIRDGDLWHGHVLKGMDGSSVQLMDTRENQKDYPQSSNQKPGCGFPIMGIMGLLNLSHGGWEHFATADHRSHDSRIAPELLPHVSEGDIVLADRAFCTYEIIAGLRQRGAHAVMRLHQVRHAALDWSKGKSPGDGERTFTWKKPETKPPGSSLDKEQWEALPATLELRYIREKRTNRGGEADELIVVTTLPRTGPYKAKEIASLYKRRWEIELKLRDMKTTLGMERFDVKTPGMAHKTLRMVMIAMNLLRCVARKSAGVEDKPLGSMSFKGLVDQVTASQESFVAHRGKPLCLARHAVKLMETCATKRISERPGRTEPRAVKRRPKPFQLLTAARKDFREVRHRGAKRKSA